MKNGLAMTATGRKEVDKNTRGICLLAYLNDNPYQSPCKGRVFVYYFPYLISTDVLIGEVGVYLESHLIG